MIVSVPRVMYPLFLTSLPTQINVSGFSIPDGDRSMVSINEVYIEHGIIHIVRVAPNQKFKALLHGQPIILESRKDPYVFNDPTFRMSEATAAASFANVNDKYISNQSLHEVRLDEGEVCLVWMNNKYVPWAPHVHKWATACARAWACSPRLATPRCHNY